MRFGSFAGGLAGGIASGMKMRDWMDEKALNDDLSSAQKVGVTEAAVGADAKFDNEGKDRIQSIKELRDAEVSRRVDGGADPIESAALVGEQYAPAISEVSRLSSLSSPEYSVGGKRFSDKSAAQNHADSVNTASIADVYARHGKHTDALKYRNAISQNQLTSLQLAEAKKKGELVDEVGKLSDQESAELARRPAALAAANEEIGAIENPTDQVKKDILLKHTGGLVPDDKVRFDFGLKRSRALERAGMFDEARKIHDESVSRAAVGFNRALMSGDYATAAQLYNIYPNGHQIKDIRPGAEKGQVIVTGADGKSMPMSVYDLVVSSTELVKPGTAASAMVSDKKYQEAIAKLMVAESGKNDRKMAEIAARIERMNGGGGSSGGASGGSGSAKGGATIGGIDSPKDYKDAMSWNESNSPSYASDAYTWNTMLQSAAGESRLANNRDRQLIRKMAERIASGEVKPEALFDPVTASWKYVVKDQNDNVFNLQNSNIDPGKLKRHFKDGSSEPLYKQEHISGAESAFVGSILKNGYLSAKPEDIKAFASNPQLSKNISLLASGKMPDGRGNLIDVSESHKNEVAEAKAMLNAVNLVSKYAKPEKGAASSAAEERDTVPLAFKIGNAFSKVGQVLNPFRTGSIEENRRKSREGQNEWGDDRNW